MGLEADCFLLRPTQRLAGRALLETDHLLFRSEGIRLRVPLSGATEVEASGGILALKADGHHIRIELGDLATRWCDRIRNPRSRIEKLGVKSGMRVSILGTVDDDLRMEIEEAGATLLGRAARDLDMLFFAVGAKAALSKLESLRGRIRPTGAIWVIHLKGKAATIKDIDVFAAAKRAGLVDNKSMSFSATHTAERLAIPVKGRPRR